MSLSDPFLVIKLTLFMLVSSCGVADGVGIATKKLGARFPSHDISLRNLKFFFSGGLGMKYPLACGLLSKSCKSFLLK